MNLLEARTELRAAWDATPFDYRRAARAMSLLLEQIDYDVTRLHKPFLAIDNTCLEDKKKG